MRGSTFERGIIVSIFLLIALSISFVAYVWSEKAIDEANDIRFTSAKLAEELRHSSDDLTKMVRAFVVTGDPTYARYFQDILDIRNGTRQRPKGYDGIYWDFVVADESGWSDDDQGGPGDALLDRMRRAGFTDQEFAKLAEAKDKSDQLTAIEFKAMSLVRDVGGPAARDEALSLVFGGGYLAEKAAIMHSINDFRHMVDSRTVEMVDFTIRRALLLRYLSIGLGVLLVLSLLNNYGSLRRLLGGTPADVHRQIATIGRGDFHGDIRVEAGSENSVLGWLAETGQKLLSMETERKKMEAQLRADEQKLRSLYELSPLGLALTDMEGRYVEFNEAFRRITGYEADELKSLGYWDLTPERYREDEARQLEMLRTTGRYGPYQKEYIRKDRTLVSLNLVGVLVTGFDGGQYIWSIVEDITDRLARERNLTRSNAELEQFAYIASHDLQTPLRNMVSYAQLLERRYKGKLDGDADDFIGFIVDNGKQMSLLIHDLLQFARVTQQSTPLQAVSAQAALEQALANLGSAVSAHAGEVFASGLPDVLGDAAQLVCLFQNLVGNALKYRHPQRPPRIRISAERNEFNQWRFSVADNGIGIAPEYRSKVFEMFQRLDPQSYPEGTGIGLTICRRIVHRLGGEISVASSSPEGTVFTFTLNDAKGPLSA